MTELEDMETYTSRIQNKVAQYISTWTIFYLCLETEQRPRSWVSMGFRDQEGIYFTDLRESGEGGLGGWRGQLSRILIQLEEAEGIM